MEDRHTLNTTEMEICKLQGDKRFSDCTKMKLENQKAGPQSDRITELQGVAGEMVVARLYNVYPDFADTPGTHDLVINGRTVDVKTTSYEGGHLQVKNTACFTRGAEVYMLVIGKFPEYRIAGWVPNHIIIDSVNLKTNPDNGSQYYQLPQSALYPIENLR